MFIFMKSLTPTGFLFSFILRKPDKRIPNFIWKNKHVRLVREMLREEKRNEGELALPDVKTHYGSAMTFFLEFSAGKELNAQSRPEGGNLGKHVGIQHVNSKKDSFHIRVKRCVS